MKGIAAAAAAAAAAVAASSYTAAVDNSFGALRHLSGILRVTPH